MKRTTLYLLITSLMSSLHAEVTVANQNSVLPTLTSNAENNKSLKDETTHASSATKMDIQLKDVPQTVNVIPLEILRDQGVTSLQQALANVPGVSMSTGDGQRDQATMRGFTSMYDTLIDGFRDDAMYYRDLSNVERIEVVKGPASVLYGRGSAGGLINRITKKPTDLEQREISLIGNSFGQKRAEIDINQPLTSTLNARLTGAVENSDGYKDAYFLKRQAVAPSLLWKVSDKTKLLIQADYLHDDRLMDLGVPSFASATKANPTKPYRLSQKTYLGAANANQVAGVDSEVSNGSITLDHQFSDALKYRGVLHGYRYNLDRKMVSASAVKANGNIDLSQSRRQRDEHGVNTQHELSGQFDTGWIKHQLLGGVEYSEQHKSDLSFNGSRINDLAINNFVAPIFSSVNTNVTPASDQDNTYKNTAFYLQDLIEFTHQIKFLAGIRYDDLDQNRKTIQNLNTTQYKRVDKTWSPRAGLIYQPIEPLSLYASYSQSFQPLADNFSAVSNLDKLQPTKTENYEIGAKWDITPQLNTTLSIFNATQNNILETDPLNSALGILAGKQRSQGVEISLTGQLTDKLSMMAGYAYLDAKMIETSRLDYKNSHAALAPNNMATLWMKYQLNDAWYLGLGGHAESARYATLSNKTILPGYAIANGAVGYHQDKYDVSLNVNNILNHRYFASAHGIGGESANLYGDSRNAQLILRYRF